MATLSTHVLDTARGVPAAGLAIRLEGEDHLDATGWRELAAATTDDDGRAKLLADGEALVPGTYRIELASGDWHDARGEAGFYPVVHVCFTVAEAGAHYHVPLLLSPYGYSTYRGS
jgi:5-hydroxyisourate hydrolase